jgi:hypothetical protein
MRGQVAPSQRRLDAHPQIREGSARLHPDINRCCDLRGQKETALSLPSRDIASGPSDNMSANIRRRYLPCYSGMNSPSTIFQMRQILFSASASSGAK